MATKKPGRAQAQKSLSTLKKLGLFKGRVRNPSRHGLAQIKKFAGVLKGDVAVLSVPPKVARDYREQYRVKYNKVLIPKAKGERVRYSKRKQEITSSREFAGKRITARKPRAVKSPYDLPRGPNIRYAVPLAGGAMRLRWDDFDQLVKDMTEYEQGRRNKYGARYAEWWKYVEIETIDDTDADADDDNF